ncbi:MAG TPA: OmpA family protein [Aquabacterium sp.]|nr:OmpA family protein [Aquabacterium sp.]HRH28548.1 OmpA family protein [Aquabacterium sp.]
MAQALPASAQILGPGQVVASGVVPDEATRQSILVRLRELYGAQRVVDQITVGSVVAPPQWRDHVNHLLSSDLKQISKGQLSIKGNTIDVQGDVANEATRQQVASVMATRLNPTYTVRNGLRVVANEQVKLDQTLGNRIVEFEPGSATLTPSGVQILDEMAGVLADMSDRRFEIVGHTDADGARGSNVALSMARAMTVKDHLAARGIRAESMATLGMGPDRPVASNTTPEGRARNRRIEFRVLPSGQ